MNQNFEELSQDVRHHLFTKVSGGPKLDGACSEVTLLVLSEAMRSLSQLGHQNASVDLLNHYLEEKSSS